MLFVKGLLLLLFCMRLLYRVDSRENPFKRCLRHPLDVPQSFANSRCQRLPIHGRAINYQAEAETVIVQFGECVTLSTRMCIWFLSLGMMDLMRRFFCTTSNLLCKRQILFLSVSSPQLIGDLLIQIRRLNRLGRGHYAINGCGCNTHRELTTWGAECDNRNIIRGVPWKEDIHKAVVVDVVATGD